MRDTGCRKASAKSLIARAAQTVLARVTKDKQDVHGNLPICHFLLYTAVARIFTAYLQLFT